eukprot:1953772-Rhodomonas_salina.1
MGDLSRRADPVRLEKRLRLAVLMLGALRAGLRKGSDITNMLIPVDFIRCGPIPHGWQSRAEG